MLPYIRRLAFFAAMFCMAGGAVRADVLTLSNGDKLKGALIKNVDGLITFKSDVLGEIIVSALKASVVVDPTPEEKAEAEAKARVEAEKKKAAELAAKKKQPVDKTKASFSAIDFRDLRSGAKKTANTKIEDTGWIHRIEFGLTNQSGRNETMDIYLRTENNRRTPKTETRFLNRYTYGEAEGNSTVDSLSSNLRFRRTLTGRLFFQSNTRYGRDRITRVGCDAEQGVGLGCNVVTYKTFVLAAGMDAALRYRTFLDQPNGTPGAPDERTTVMNIFQDMSMSINPRFSLTQDFLALVNTSNADEQKYNFNAGLSGRITTACNITTRIGLEYDKALLSDQRYHQRITTTFGYVF